ncbi:single-stranded DNA-binding protein [Sphaerimonospora cavernae]|uniref:Single-stranded DNA-binding protein n=1 Tax=Sphaerimonospora cavernae TaxID=1740611 RepID=A0ABV6U3X3_9ACTN
MHRNEVVLVGRLSMEPVHRDLPSGNVLTQWRLAVRRPAGHPGYQRSDAVECATFDDRVRDMLDGWRLDDVVEVEGALRRRWWLGGNRYEVEVSTARRVDEE